MLGALKNAESNKFLKVPIVVPPMIEDAFGYGGDEQYVSLGFGVHGGRMSDFLGDGVTPNNRDLYRSFLLHPALKPYTEAFRLETAPPPWLDGMPIEESNLHMEEFQAWSETARCLLLDRESREFFVDTVARVRSWLILRPILYQSRRRCEVVQGYWTAEGAERALWDWLNAQPPAALSEAFVKHWEEKFQETQSVSACIGAGVKLGFGARELKQMVIEAFHKGKQKDMG